MANIRPRTPSDLDELVELAAEVRLADGYPVYLPDGDFRRFLTEPNPLGAWVAEEGARIVGHVAANSESNKAVMEVVRQAGIEGDLGVIARLLVDPGSRRRGIGARLLHQAVRHVMALCRTPVLDVVTSAKPAISLYVGAGWREIGKVRFDVPGDVMTELVYTLQVQHRDS